MTTVFITIDWFHPAYKAGGPVQSIANLVQQYREPGIQFRVFCSNKDLDGTINTGVPFDTWVHYNDYTQVWYASPASMTVAAVKRELQHTKADILFVIGFFSWYLKQWSLLFTRDIKVIVSVRGMLHPGALTQYRIKKNLYLRLWKIAGLHKRFFFHATDAQEEVYIREIFGPKARISIAGNFPRVFGFKPVTDKVAGFVKLVSVAVVSPMKNILLVLQALQHCTHRVQYDIYGPVKNEPYWQECLAAIRGLPVNITVSYKNNIVPAKVEATLGAYDVFILPSKSENFGHAIFEALSSGKPVITSHHTPFNRLYEEKAGVNVTAEQLPEITKAINFFAEMDQQAFAAWNQGAHRYAVQHMDLDQLKTQYNNLFSMPPARV